LQAAGKMSEDELVVHVNNALGVPATSSQPPSGSSSPPKPPPRPPKKMPPKQEATTQEVKEHFLPGINQTKSTNKEPQENALNNHIKKQPPKTTHNNQELAIHKSGPIKKVIPRAVDPPVPSKAQDASPKKEQSKSKSQTERPSSAPSLPHDAAIQLENLRREQNKELLKVIDRSEVLCHPSIISRRLTGEVVCCC